MSPCRLNVMPMGLTVELDGSAGDLTVALQMPDSALSEQRVSPS